MIDLRFRTTQNTDRSAKPQPPGSYTDLSRRALCSRSERRKKKTTHFYGPVSRRVYAEKRLFGPHYSVLLCFLTAPPRSAVLRAVSSVLCRRSYGPRDPRTVTVRRVSCENDDDDRAIVLRNRENRGESSGFSSVTMIITNAAYKGGTADCVLRFHCAAPGARTRAYGSGARRTTYTTCTYDGEPGDTARRCLERRADGGQMRETPGTRPGPSIRVPIPPRARPYRPIEHDILFYAHVKTTCGGGSRCRRRAAVPSIFSRVTLYT